MMDCKRCGWGKDRADQARRHGLDSDPGPTEPPLALVLLGLVFSVLLVVGPYGALLHYVQRVEVWMRLLYWLTMTACLFFSMAVPPSYDASNMGLFGTTIEKLFTFADDKKVGGPDAGDPVPAGQGGELVGTGGCAADAGRT